MDISVEETRDTLLAPIKGYARGLSRHSSPVLKFPLREIFWNHRSVANVYFSRIFALIFPIPRIELTSLEVNRFWNLEIETFMLPRVFDANLQALRVERAPPRDE